MEILANVADGFFEKLLALLVYVGAFAAIPFLAKRFTGALGQLTGMVNDRSKGLFDRGKKAAENWAKEMQEIQKGTREEERRVAEAERAAGGEEKARRWPFGKKSGKSWRRLFSGGSLLDSDVKKSKDGAKTKDGKKRSAVGKAWRQRREAWRQAADARFTQGRGKIFKDSLEASQAAMAGASFEALDGYARDLDGSLIHRTAAILALGKAGAVGQIEELMHLRESDVAHKEDFVLQSALIHAREAGMLYEANIKVKAPHFTRAKVKVKVEADEEGPAGVWLEPPSAKAMLQTIGNIANNNTKEINDASITSWRSAIGLKPVASTVEGAPDEITLIRAKTEEEKRDIIALRKRIIELAGFLMDEKNVDAKTGASFKDGLNRDKLRLFERVYNKEGEFLAEAPPPDEPSSSDTENT